MLYGNKVSGGGTSGQKYRKYLKKISKLKILEYDKSTFFKCTNFFLIYKSMN